MHPRLAAAWAFASRMDSASRAEVEIARETKLVKLLKHAATTVPYYRRWFEGKNVDLDSLRITDFPIVTKADIRAQTEEFISDKFKKSDLNRSSTSGSTGEPFTFYKSKRGMSFDYTYATLWRGLLRFGVRPGDKRVLVKGVNDSVRLSFKDRLKRWLYGKLNRCIVIDAHFLAKSDENVRLELNRLLSYRPDYLHGYASSLYVLARYADDHQVDVSALKLKAVVTESEKCLPFHREMLEKVFGTTVVENYGSVEFGMIAQPATDGVLCINEDHVYVETTPEGDAVLTNLDEYGFPFIRYQNGDVLKLGARHGTLPYRTIEEVDGRKTELIKLPQGGALQGFIVMHPLYRHGKFIKAYQVYQPELTKLFIRIVPVGLFPPEIIDKITSDMRALVGSEMSIQLDLVAEIPLTKRGKRLFVCSDVR